MSLQNLDKSWNNIKRIAIFGYGRTSHGVFKWLINNFTVDFIIDNAKKYRESKHDGVNIYAFDLVKDNIRTTRTKIVITAMGAAEQSIIEVLKKENFRENIDFCSIDTFVSEYSFRFRDKICLNRVTVWVTRKCTLNCEGCNNFNPYYKHKEDYELENLKKDVDLLFSKVDHVINWTVLGGEPFVFDRLYEYISYIGDKYISTGKITQLQITTNGTVIPDDMILQLLKKYDAYVQISDYTNTVKYSDKLEEVEKKLSSAKVNYWVVPEMKWLDIGFPEKKVEIKGNIEDHMKKCHNTCQTLHYGKYYFCGVAGAVAELDMYSLAKNDCIDLYCASGIDILKYHMGNDIPNGYLNFCCVCGGLGSDNTKIIKAGNQIKLKQEQQYE